MSTKVNIDVKLKDGVTPGANTASKSVRGLGQSSKKTKGSLSNLLGTFNPFKIGLAAITAALGVSIAEFAKFESKIVDVGNLFGATDKEMENFQFGILEISKKVPVATQELADGLFDVVSAGVAVGDSLKFLESASKLAVAGVTDVKTAVDGTTSVMNAYGVEFDDVEKITDKFFAAQQKGKTTIAELSASIGQVAPMAANAGVSIDELFGAISSLTLQGVKTTEAVTQIKATISALIKPSKEASDYAKSLGIEFNLAGLEAKGMAGFMQDVMKKTGGSTEALGKLFPSVEALNAVLALSKNNFEDLKSIQSDVANSFGLTDAAAKKQSETISGATTLMTSEFGAFSKTLIDDISPAIVAVINLLGGMGKAINKLYEIVTFKKPKNILLSDEQIQAEIDLIKKEEEEIKTSIKNTSGFRRQYLENELNEHTIKKGERLALLTEELEERQTLKSEAQEAENETEIEKLAALNQAKLDKQREFNEEFYSLEMEKIEGSDELDTLKLKKKIDLLKKIQKEEKIDDQKRKELQTKQAKFENKLNEEKATIAMDALRRVSVFQNSESKELRLIGQAAASAMAVINTAEAVTKALAVLGPIAGPIAATAIGAAGAAQVATINGVKFHGGRDPSTGVDNEIPAMIQQSETVLTAQDRASMISGINQLGEQVAQLSTQISQGGVGGNINITLEIDGEAIAQAVVPYLDGATAQMERGI
jgi:TP901 family phage tail tape measure protein